MTNIDCISYLNECINALQKTGRTFDEAIKLVKLSFSVKSVNMDFGKPEPRQKKNTGKIGFNI